MVAMNDVAMNGSVEGFFKDNANITPEAPLANKDATGVKAVEQKDKLPWEIDAVDLSQATLPDLDQAEVLPINLMDDYWTPTQAGEKKRVFFAHIATAPYVDADTGEAIELECAYFLEQIKLDDGRKEFRMIRNGSVKLVASIKKANIKRGTPLEIEYRGKIASRVNANRFMDNWSIKILRLK